MSAPLAELAGRFAALLVLLAALGAAPASLLPRDWPGRARVALAPVLGLCLAACGCTTLEWFLPADRFAWVLPAAAAVSLAIAAGLALRRARSAAGPARRAASPAALALGAAEVLVVCAATFLPTATVLAAHHSVGPMSYEVFDGPGYVANAEAAQTVSIRVASTRADPPNYVQRWWHLDTASSNRLDYAPVVAAADALLGLDATQTYAADLLAVLAAGGLGCAAAVLVAAPGARRGFATLAGAAFGGSFFLQLVFDGSQAALTGLVVLVPLLLLLAAAARAPAPGTLAVVALATGGLATLYPIFLFPLLLVVVVAGALALLRAARAARAARAVPGGRASRDDLAGGVLPPGRGAAAARALVWPWARRVAAVVAGAAVLDVVATVRDARSLASIATGGGILSSFPAYHLGAGVVGSWLLQTRDLYGVAFAAQSPLADVLPALLVPGAALVVALTALRRTPVAWLALGLVAVSLALGAYEAVAHGCGYCEDRSLLSAVPPLVFLVFAGLGTALSGDRRRPSPAASDEGAAPPTTRRGPWRAASGAVLVAVAGAYLGTVAYGAANARSRYGGGSVYVTSAERSLVDRLPRGTGPVELEGFGADASSIAVEPYLYELLVARGDTVSAATAQEGAGLAEDWGPRPLRPPWFDPSYRYVLTGLGGVRLDRRRLAAAGRMALERRAGPDVTVEAGLGFPTASARLPAVTGPLRVVVTGAGPGPVAVRARLVAGDPAGGSSRTTGTASACVQLGGGSAVRTGSLHRPGEVGTSLAALSVAPGRC